MSKTKTKKPPRPVEDVSVCMLCEDQPAFHANETRSSVGCLIDHCKEMHPELIDAEGKSGATMKGTSFLDGSDFYENTFEIHLPDGRLLGWRRQSGPRARW